jgi:hypothetical protein
VKSAADVDEMALLVTFDDVTDGAGACLKVIMGRCPKPLLLFYLDIKK